MFQPGTHPAEPSSPRIYKVSAQNHGYSSYYENLDPSRLLKEAIAWTPKIRQLLAFLGICEVLGTYVAYLLRPGRLLGNAIQPVAWFSLQVRVHRNRTHRAGSLAASFVGV